MTSSAAHPTKRIAALILAAGRAERMGQAKVLLPWTDEKTILEHIIQQLRAAVTTVIVITGAYHLEVREIAENAQTLTVHNPDYAAGEMLSSLKVGLNALLPESIDAVLVVLGDQPQIEIETIQAVIQAYYEEKGTLIAPRFEGQRGHPVLFDRRHWAALCALPPDSAPRALFKAHPESVFMINVSSDSILRDIDTPADYADARKSAGLTP